MKRRFLGGSDLEITLLGFGAWAIGGPGWTFAWGAQDDEDSIAAIHEAIDRGINWIDTAAVYGLGHSEAVVAMALEGMSKRPYIFTKCERVWDENGQIGKSLKPDSIRRECEASLRRLKVDCIDLYQVHWPEPETEIEEGWATLAALKTEGKIRHIGVSNFNVAQMQRIEGIAPITSLQPPYSLCVRGVEEEILPYCASRNIGVIVYSPMRNGLLSGMMTRERIADLPADDWRRNNPDFREPLLTRNLELVEVLREVGDRHFATPGEVAVAWTLCNPAVTGAIVGFRKAGQATGLTKAATLQLTSEDLARIDDFLAAG